MDNSILLKITPSGASMRTAKQDKLPMTGVEASTILAQHDTSRILAMHTKFRAVGAEFVLPPAVMAGIASRESRGGALLKDGWDQQHFAFGVCQVDFRSHKILGMPDPTSIDHIRQAASILKCNWDEIGSKFPQWSDEETLQAAIAAYNMGVKNIRTLANLDKGTTNNDYSNDVWARAQFFADMIN